MINTDGTASYVDVPPPTSITDIPGSDFSWSGTLEVSDVSATTPFKRIIDATHTSSNFAQLTLQSNSTGSLTFVVEDTSTQRGSRVTSGISANTRYNFVCTWNSATNTASLFLDAVTQAGTPELNAGPGTAGEFNIGRRTDNGAGTHVAVEIEDFRVYDRVLTKDEITTINSCEGHDDIVNGLEARYLMNEKSTGETAGVNTFYKDSTTAGISSTNITINVPTVADGDLMVAMICPGGNSSGTPSNVTTPSGWTQIGTVDLPSTASTPSLWIYRRTASSEPGTYNFSINQTASICAIMVTYDGNEVGTTQDAIASGTGTTASPIAPTISPSDNAIVLRIAATDAAQLPTPVSDFYPSSTIGREALEQTGVGNGCTLGFADHLAPSGAAGTSTFTAAASDQWGCFSVAFIGGDGDNDQNTILDVSINESHAAGMGGVTYSPSGKSFKKRILG